jgi:hypothetical protein
VIPEWTGRREDWGQIQANKVHCLFTTHRRWASPQPSYNTYETLSPGIKKPEREARLPHSSGDGKVRMEVYQQSCIRIQAASIRSRRYVRRGISASTVTDYTARWKTKEAHSVRVSKDLRTKVTKCCANIYFNRQCLKYFYYDILSGFYIMMYSHL